MTGKIIKIGVALVVAAAAVSTVATRVDAVSGKDLAAYRHQLRVEQYQRTQQYKDENNWQIAKSRVVYDNAPISRESMFDRSIMTESQVPGTAFQSYNAGPPPAPSPGLDIGNTAYDYQANGSQGHNVARTPTGPYIHFTWMTFREIPANLEDLERTCAYSSYNAATLAPESGYNGTDITGADQRGGYVDIDVTSTNQAQVALHRKEQAGEYYKAWHVRFPFPPAATQDQIALDISSIEDCLEWLWPRIAADRANTVIHEIAHDDDNPVTGPGTPPPPGGTCLESKMYYWRFDPTAAGGAGDWTGPALLDTSGGISYAIAVDDIGAKVAVVTQYFDLDHPADPVNVYYLESTTDGVDWINTPTLQPRTRHFISNYTDENGPQSYYNISAAYDRSSVLHVVYDEQLIANVTGQNAVVHWNSVRNSIRPVALGYWDLEVSDGSPFDLNLTKVSIGIGDGATLCKGGAESNNNYVYVTWCQAGGETEAEQQDYSSLTSVTGRSGGFTNYEVYLAVSNSGGLSWGPATNLTNTKTPGCNPGVANPLGVPQFPDSVCRSEMWATLGRVVSDIDIFFVSDLDAGGIPQGAGSWQLNPVHYLQLPGGTTDAQYVCPVIAPVFAASLGPSDPENPSCEYHATPSGSTTATLSILNLGNDDLDEGAGTGITIQDFPGNPTLTMPLTGAYTIVAGASNISQTVTMAANNAPEGLYTGIIRISHNAAQTNPWVDTVDFFVFTEFFCPEAEIVKTGVSPAALFSGNAVQNPGSLALDVGSDGNFAAGPGNGTLWRYIDSAQAISSGSFLLAHGTQGVDTTVWMAFGSAQNNGANGFRSQEALYIDTTVYGSQDGYASAGAYMTTKDSVLGVNVSWYFPQDPDVDEVVYVNYLVFPGPHFTGTPISNVTAGLIADFDVIPAQRNPIDTMQEGTHNRAQPGDLGRSLAYMRGTVKPSANPNLNPLNDPRRWNAGVAMPTGYEGAYIGNFALDVGQAAAADPLIYSRMTSMSGGTIQIYSPVVSGDTDLYILVGLEKGQTYQSVASTYRATTVHSHTLILVSDSINADSLKMRIDQATVIVDANTFDGCAVCPCRYDPSCDGIISDVLDVTAVIGRAFRGVAPPAGDEACNYERSDVDASGNVDILDVSKTVDVAFRGFLPTATNKYTDPCTKWKP